MKQLKMFGVAACAVVLASCTTMGGDKRKLGNMLGDITDQNGRACVKVSEIEGYGVLQENVISIEGEDEHFLATVAPDCGTDLTASARIMFSGDFGEVCGQAMDEIVMGSDRCTINELFEFDDREDAMSAYHTTLEMQEQLNDKSG